MILLFLAHRCFSSKLPTLSQRALPTVLLSAGMSEPVDLAAQVRAAAHQRPHLDQLSDATSLLRQADNLTETETFWESLSSLLEQPVLQRKNHRPSKPRVGLHEDHGDTLGGMRTFLSRNSQACRRSIPSYISTAALHLEIPLSPYEHRKRKHFPYRA